MKQTLKPIANPMVVLRQEQDNQAVLFNPDTGHALSTNAVGVAVWRRLDGWRSLQEIVTEVSQLFDEVPDNILEEMALFVEQLAKEGFVGYEVGGPHQP
jgi:SynChlorMet cassette protein ScmD